MPKNRTLSVLSFSRAAISGIWLDEGEPLVWPIDLMHFDSYSVSDIRWKFVLNCQGLELVGNRSGPKILFRRQDNEVRAGAASPVDRTRLQPTGPPA
jgi:hypothetical protein